METNYYYEAIKAHRESTSKFDYFFVGVILATVSLSIQSFDLSNETYLFESLLILSWSLWIISFLAGMFRLERINVYLASEAEKMRLSRLQPSTEEQRQLQKKSLEDTEAEEDKYAGHILNAYRIQKYFYVLGLILYVVFKCINIQ